MRRDRMSVRLPLAGPLLFVLGALALSALAPMWLYTETGESQNGADPWWSMAVIVIVGLRFAWVLGSSTRHIFEMVLWLFTYIFMGMAPYVQYRLGVNPSTTAYVHEGARETAGVLVLVGIFALMLGSWLGRARIRAGVKMLRVSVVSERKANLLAWAAMALFVYYGLQVGFSSFWISRAQLAVLRAEVWPEPAVNAMMTGGMTMSLLVAFVAQMVVRQQRKLSGRRGPVLMPLILAVLTLWAVNPVSSPRFVFGTVFLAMLATLGVYGTLARFRAMSVAALVGMLTAFPLADLFRFSTDATFEVEGPLEAMLSGDFDSFNQVVNSVSYVQNEGITWGMQGLGVLFFWVPRSIWETKPIDSGSLLAEYMGYTFKNLSAPIWAELFMNGGWVALVLGLGVLGYAFRVADYRTHIYLRSSRVPPVFVTVVAFYLLLLLRGSLLTAASYLLVITVCAWFVSARKPRSRVSGRTRASVAVGPSPEAARPPLR